MYASEYVEPPSNGVTGRRWPSPRLEAPLYSIGQRLNCEEYVLSVSTWSSAGWKIWISVPACNVAAGAPSFQEGRRRSAIVVGEACVRKSNRNLGDPN